MSDSRSFRGPRREGGSRRRRDRGGADTPYSRGRYTSGDASQSWKHDLFDKASDEGKEVEETGWGTRRSRHDEDLARGTPVVVSNLHWEVSEDDLKSVFSEQVGPVQSAKISYDRAGRSTGNATVVFEHHSDADRALELDGKKMKGQAIEVRLKPAPVRAAPSSRIIQPRGDRMNDRPPKKQEVVFTVRTTRRR